MNWRPDNWENIFNPAAITVKDRNGKPISHHEAFEAGADAILEALKRKGFRHDCTSKMAHVPGFADVLVPSYLPHGWLVFIPEEVTETPTTLYGGDVMPRVDGKPFRCGCGCNVFKQVRKDPNHYRCNACGVIYEGTPKEATLADSGSDESPKS